MLHVIRYRREKLNQLIDAINATGYSLTFGLHTRLDDTIAHVSSRVKAGNLYINRNLIGAVVGVQPFGGRNLCVLHPRSRILLRPATAAGLNQKIAAVLAAGCHGAVEGMDIPAGLQPRVAARLSTNTEGNHAAALVDGERIAATLPELAALPGPIITAHLPGKDVYHLDWLLEEVSTSINTTAASGNASLMMLA